MEQQQAAHNAAACDLASADPTPFTVEAESLADACASADARRKRCIAVADRGMQFLVQHEALKCQLLLHLVCAYAFSYVLTSSCLLMHVDKQLPSHAC